MPPEQAWVAWGTSSLWHRGHLCLQTQSVLRTRPRLSRHVTGHGQHRRRPCQQHSPPQPPSKATQWRELLWEAPQLRLYFKHRLPAEARLPRASPTPEPDLPPPASPLSSTVPPKAPFPCTAKHGPDGSKVSQISPYGVFSPHDTQPVLGATAADPHTVTRSRGRGRCCLRLKEPGRDSWGHRHRFAQGRGVGNAWLLPNPARV